MNSANPFCWFSICRSLSHGPWTPFFPLLRLRPVDGPDERLSSLNNARGLSVITMLLCLNPRLFVIDAQIGPVALDQSKFGAGYCIAYR
jgi:hypothetical protein